MIRGELQIPVRNPKKLVGRFKKLNGVPTCILQKTSVPRFFFKDRRGLAIPEAIFIDMWNYLRREQL